LVLRYFDDLAVPDVARALGKSVHATESLLARGRDGLRSHYRADTEDE
jgi:RNA polymerase sigma-70 factor (ECF subfamily)